MINEYASNAGSQPAGFLNPTIYQIGNGSVGSYAASFNDVTKGNNKNTCGFGYPAGPGYDLTTGWGSPTCSLITGATPNVEPVSVGLLTACSVTASGGVNCWGDNSSGQLGDGTLTSRPYPMPALGNTGFPLTGVASVSVGTASACALTTGGGVVCWGDDQYYQLGDDGDSPRGYTTGLPMGGFDASPRVSLYAGQVFGLGAGIVEVSVGNTFACALTSQAGVLCWGDDSLGQLGDDQMLAVDRCGAADELCSPWPIPVQGLASNLGGFDGNSEPLNNGTNLTATGTATTISTGDWFVCVATTSGTAECWGTNQDEQLGLGAEGLTESLIPVQLEGLGGVTAVAAGATFACASTQDGGISCWGDNEFGELGNTGAAPGGNPMPVVVQNLTSSIAVFAGGNSACAVPLSGGLVCWGENYYGQLGNGVTSSNPTPPGVVTGLTLTASEVVLNRAAVSVGYESACAVNASGVLECWGDDSAGEVGNNVTTSTPISAPVPVVAGP